MTVRAPMRGVRGVIPLLTAASGGGMTLVAEPAGGSTEKIRLAP